MSGRSVPPAVVDAVLEDYLAGEKIAAIAAEHGVSEQYPFRLARRLGLPVRVKHRPPREREQ